MFVCRLDVSSQPGHTFTRVASPSYHRPDISCFLLLHEIGEFVGDVFLEWVHLQMFIRTVFEEEKEKEKEKEEEDEGQLQTSPLYVSPHAFASFANYVVAFLSVNDVAVSKKSVPGR